MSMGAQLAWVLGIVLAVYAGLILAMVITDRRPGSRCRACGRRGVVHGQDGGHDWTEDCPNCGARYGVQGPPFNIVERIR